MTARSASEEAEQAVPNAIHLPMLLLALGIMLVGTVYPLVFSRADGSADHRLALALFWAMSAGLVRGVGFVPRANAWRLLFSAGSCMLALALAVWIRFGN